MSMLREPVGCVVDPVGGGLVGHSRRYEKKIRDLSGIYRDVAAFDACVKKVGDELAYYVEDFRQSEDAGDLIFGTTWMAPGRIGAEYFMTRGHIHANGNRPEIYYAQSGKGVMLMESPEGATRLVELAPQTLCYVPPYWIHRSVNTGSDPLVMVFCYPADAGQDYGIIAASNGMASLVVADPDGGWHTRPNPDYAPRSADSAQRIYNQAEGGK